VIPSSQGFFVKLAAAGVYTTTLSISENAKVSGNSTFLRTATSVSNALKINLTKTGSTDGYSYMGEVRFSEAGNDGKDVMLDIPNFEGSRFSFSMPVENEDMILNTMGSLTETKNIPMNTRFKGAYGTYQFAISGIDAFPAGTNVYMKDNLLGTLQNVTFNPNYTFDVTGSNASVVGRFELIVSPDAVTGTMALVNGVEMNIAPNPTSKGKVTLSVSGFVQGAAKVMITDVLGKVVMTSDLNLVDGNNLRNLDINLASGMYSVKVITATKSVTQKLIVK
jgi:hypothetical protein